MSDQESRVLYSRNPPFIDLVTQDRLGSVSVGLVGCGLASQIAVDLARVGVRRFRIWDYDEVELSNLNRQAFFAHDLGINKAVAVERILRSFDPSIYVRAYPKRLATDNLIEQLNGLDIVVNSADFNDAVYYDIADIMQTRGAWTLYPMNLGLGGLSMVLGPDSPSLAQLTGGRTSTAGGFLRGLSDSCQGFHFSEELLRAGLAILTQVDAIGWFPQNVVATSITSALVTFSVVRIVQGRGREIAAPRVLHFEPT